VYAQSVDQGDHPVQEMIAEDVRYLVRAQPALRQHVPDFRTERGFRVEIISQNRPGHPRYQVEKFQTFVVAQLAPCRVRSGEMAELLERDGRPLSGADHLDPFELKMF
jgi:hypothetical protein